MVCQGAAAGSRRCRIRFRLPAAAERDFIGIVEWTTGGIRHPSSQDIPAYTDARAHSTLSEPGSASSPACDEIRPGLRSLHVAGKGRRGRHFIAYWTPGAERIQAVRILHESMDISRYFRAQTISALFGRVGPGSCSSSCSNSEALPGIHRHDNAA
jgi:toxin ParE1/3/4